MSVSSNLPTAAGAADAAACGAAGACVHDLFRAQAARTPEAVALSRRGERLTYARLEARANRLAHALRRRGVGPEVRVGICLPRTPELVVALLGVLKAGGAYVPLDPAYPPERLGFMIRDAAIGLVITDSAHAGRLPSSAAALLLLDREADALAAEPSGAPESGALPENLSHVIFTSGSTGWPKGVMIRHASVVVLLRWLRENVTDEERSSLLFSTSASFDVSVAEIFGTLCWGGKLVIAENALELPALDEEVVLVGTGPTAAAELLRGGGIPPCVKTLHLAGEALPPALARALYALGTVEKVVNLYGPTEDTTYSTCSVVPRGAERVLIGTPLTGTRAYVLDAELRPAPEGEAGELYLAGDGVARGYANRPALTAERFLPCPFGPPGARMYRVMDRARRGADGVLEYLGRADLQVKIRGFRIEPGEVEARLGEHPEVRMPVVLARGEAGDRRLVAYYLAEAPLDAGALRAHLAARLPEHMVPAAYVWMEAYPRTPNGKVDRDALPAPEREAYAARAYEAPAGEAERALAAIWSEVLGVSPVGRGDRFLALGGHSLVAVRAIWRMREALGAEVPLEALFAHPLAELARTLESAAPAEAAAIAPVERGAAVPLSFAQRRLWFLEQLGGTGAAYHVSLRLRLRGSLDRGALARALDRVVARHESLRTVFPAADGEPEARIAPAEAGGFPLRDADLAGRADAEAELRRLAAADEAAPFDLARGPLVRGRLVRMGPDDHALLVTMHHVVSDGWSLGVLEREVAALYAAFSRGEPDPLPPLPVRYADYAAWQRGRVAGAALEAQAAYWARTLAGAPERLELPADRPRPARQDHAGASVEVALDEALTGAVTALGRRHGTTPFMTVLAGWAAVLARLSGQDDVVVGTPAAGRGRAEVEGVIGLFVNTLALRVDLSGSPTVAELLGRVRARVLEAQRHQDLPFEQVVERVRPARTLAHTPLFQVILAWQEMPGGAPEMPGLSAAPLDGVGEAAAQFDLSLLLAPRGGRIAGEATYATALFDRATVERYVGYLRRALAEMAADDARPVDGLDLLSAAERRRVVEEWNATDAAYPAGACVHHLVAAQAARTPEAAAVSWRGETVSYAALDRRANRLAHHLRARGVGPEVRVGVCLPRTPELLVALLGVMKAGGAYVPLDPAQPAARLGAMLQDAEIPLVLTDSRLAERLPPAAGLLLLDREREALAAAPATAPESGVVDENVSHVIFTSGSTGRPKGVMIRHSSVVVLLRWMRENVADEERASVLCSTSINFDVSVAEIFGALAWGGTLVLAENALALAELAEPVAYVSMVPTAAAELLAAGAIPPSVRTVNLAGEALPPALAQGLYALGTVRAVRNLYGPTEDTSYSTCAVAEPGAARVPIGRPLANTRAYVLDARLQPVPEGAAGELYLAGAGLARGYASRPALTAERFLPCPFGPPGARMYRTGDRARWRPDGMLEYLGRIDFQVKVRGFRIEPGEIEARLREHPAVRQAVVLAREDAPGERRLVAYVVGGGGGIGDSDGEGDAVDAEALRAHLAASLPEYMVPAAYVRLDALPLTPSGKLDRNALPAPDRAAYARRGDEAPAGPVETALAEIWAEVLGVERVGRRDHFFDLGGHSLLGMRVVSRVRRALGVDASPGDLFERPVLADFARGVETAARADAEAIAPADRGAPVPLSFAQRRLWFLEQLGGTGAAYHVPWRLRLRGALDRGALARALARVVARHESLRTVFATADGEPVQRIAPADAHGFALRDDDLAGRADAEAALRRLAAEEAAAPFDLERGPLFRARLVRLAADDHALLATLHHAVSDGWSLWVLERELSALYAAFARGEADPLPPLPVQYADYAAWQRRRAAGAAHEAEAAYWTETLAGAPELLELPADRPRPPRQDHAGASVAVELDEALAAGIRELGRRHGATPFMTLLAGWAAVLARLSGQDDVVVGTPWAGRGRGEIEGLIGFFVNTLPLRVDLSGAPTGAELLGRVRARALEAQRRQDVPFDQVVERVRPVRSLAHTPVFQVMFAWQEMPGGAPELPGLAAAPLEGVEDAASAFDLELVLAPRGGRIAGALTCAAALFDRATAERYAGYLRRALEEMVADDARPVDRLALVSPAERRRVVEEWSRTEGADPGAPCVHHLFEAQAARTPGAAAVVFAATRLTYAELNARANRLARHLRALGVGPEARVAVCLERGAETMVALLAVLKAGGGYVPLDPAYPEDRLRFSLEDAAPAALLTRAPLGARFAGAGVPVVDLDDGAAWGAHSASDLDPAGVGAGADGLAYVIYTSGSTGTPKGVPVRHGALANLLASSRAAFGVGPGDVMPALASGAFDISLWETLLPLVSGATLRMVARERVMDARVLLGEIADATLLHAVPALMREIARAEREAPRLSRLRATFVGGDQVPADLLAEMAAAFPAARTHVLYGPTEATILASAHAVPADGAITGHPIGRPLGNVRLYVLDAGGRPQPNGVAGELMIGGAGVARGYLGRPALTAERFVPDPLSGVPGARLYRTGDLCRWREGAEAGEPGGAADPSGAARTGGSDDSRAGFLEFLGRTDFQVKIRGFRIEPGEIEARLRDHPAVREAVVVAREDAPGEKRLVAYVVGDTGAEALRAHLAAALPAHMVPAAYVRLRELPLTPTGKVDRNALPAPLAAAYGRRTDERPRGPTEEALAEIWAEVLGVERVGRRDHFFDMGGHSLLAARLVGRVREALNPAATLDDVFAHPTLFALAMRLDARDAWLGADHAVPVRETGSERPLFVVHDATGLVFYGQLLRPHLDPEIPVYALPGPLNDADDLDSLDDLVARLVRMVVQAQPEGPYRLAGWSAGGLFAYAAAERLVETGRAVEFVGLMDTSHPAILPNDALSRARLFVVLELLARDSGAPPATPAALRALKDATEGLELPAFIATCHARGLLPESVTQARARQVWDRITLLRRAAAEFVPRPISVPVHLFVSTEEVEGDPRRGWQDMPGGDAIRLERVPGAHHSMWRKGNVEALGASLSRALRASAADAGEPVLQGVP